MRDAHRAGGKCDPDGTDRDRNGRFIHGNTVAVRTGEHANGSRLPVIFQTLNAEVANFLEASLTDDGGRDQIPTRRLSQHQYRAVLHQQILRLSLALDTHRLFDRRGRLRVAWLSKLKSLMREARAFDASLDLARRPRRVSLHGQADTRTMNATISQEVIDRAYPDHDAVARAEYGAQFRCDIESFLSREALDAVTVPGRFELPPVAGGT